MNGMAELTRTADVTIGELADRTGVTASALRFYEREGLITSRRTTGNQRRYSENMLRRVAFIRASQRVGVPLAMIRDVLALFPDGRTPTPSDWARVASCWQAELEARIARLTGLRGELGKCLDCGCLSMDQCALVHPDTGEPPPAI
jgi:MerR family redox-sensitive transcriptional activator SoxR